VNELNKLSTAERLLTLATTPERAAVIVGDLVELGAPVWPHVIRTAGSLMVKDLLRSPWRVLLTGGGIFLRQFIGALMVSIANTIAFRIYGLKAMPSLLVYEAICLLCFGWTQYLLGRELRRNAGRHALAACVVLAVLNLSVTLVWNLNMVSLPLVLWQIPIVLGMLLSKPKQPESAIQGERYA
jgi:hypothetical protein